MKTIQLYTWKDNRHLPDIDDEQVEDNVSVSADGGLLGGDDKMVSGENEAVDWQHLQHVPPQLELLVVACLSTHVISSIREPVG
jgi:hypothetical protein